MMMEAHSNSGGLRLTELNASNKSSYRVLRPHDFLNALSRAANSSSQNGGGSVIGRRWLGFEQQDAHELYQLISSHIQTEHETCQSAKCGCCTGKKFQTTGLGDIFDLGPSKDAVVGPGDGRQELRMRNPSLGLVGSRLRCEECGYETPVRHQTFDNLSLVPPYEPTITLSALLAFYTSPEYLDDVVCPRCSIKLTLEKLKVLIDKGRKKCEIARKVYEAQAKEKEGQVPSEGAVVANGHSAAEAEPASNGKDQKGVAQAAEVNSLSALFPKIATLPSLPRETLALLDLPFSAIQEELSLPPEDSESAILRIDTELRRLHDLLHDLDLLERTSPDEFLDLGKDTLSIEKVTGCGSILVVIESHENLSHFSEQVRHVPTPPHRTTKRLTISRFPKVLALHVQRSVYLASGRAVKNSCRIGGLGELWDASLPGARRRSGIFARADGGGDSARQLYRLQAIVLHYGSHDSGHFVTYRRMPAKGFGNPGQWAQIEEALEKIARGQDPQGRLAAWVDEWCSATLGIPKESAPAKTTEATNPTEVTDSENGHVSAAPNGDAATTPAPIIQDNVADSLAVDTSLSAAKPNTAAPGGDSPTLHGSVDGDGTADTALDTDTDTGSNAFAGADGDLSSSQPDLVALRPEGSDHAPTPVPGQQPLGSDATLSDATPNVSAPSPSPKFVKPAKPPRPADAWFRISDEHVELVEDPEREIYAMLSGQAYMFYFEREE